jgi:hypothetical protein
MESSNSQAYIGYSKQGNNVWTVGFNLIEPPENENIHFRVTKFKILQIEDADGKLLRKIPGYAINSEYCLRKHPIRVFLKRENADFHKFYERNKKKYDNYTGSVTEYYFDGNVFCTYFLVSGKLNGQFIAKKKNEEIIEKSFFVDNLRHGLTTVIKNKYEIQCEYNMGGLININIIDSNLGMEIYNINDNDIHKRQMVDEHVKPIPQAICDPRYVSNAFYNYWYGADD